MLFTLRQSLGQRFHKTAGPRPVARDKSISSAGIDENIAITRLAWVIKTFNRRSPPDDDTGPKFN